MIKRSCCCCCIWSDCGGSCCCCCRSRLLLRFGHPGGRRDGSAVGGRGELVEDDDVVAPEIGGSLERVDGLCGGHDGGGDEGGAVLRRDPAEHDGGRRLGGQGDVEVQLEEGGGAGLLVAGGVEEAGVCGVGAGRGVARARGLAAGLEGPWEALGHAAGGLTALFSREGPGEACGRGGWEFQYREGL